ncbi:hypothetical protein fugu_015559 [Takifugu bimaculatus]|uniref:Tubulin epsilon and delta complex protein 2 n=1 Tax=Takifugu bimaculatus TaxID=433685 RepID=A0A4Z2BZ38_9TELE|nr:hypothetical protein fugu_015559 [Takifugu bimaculatus]
MSLLSSIQQAIKSRKAEQAHLNDRIQVYREILQSLASSPPSSTCYQEPECTSDASADAGASARERKDIELLEQALEKALKVRAGNGPSKKDSKTPSLTPKEMQDAVVVRKEGPLASAPSKGKQSSRSASKSASSNRTQPIHSGQLHNSALNAKEKVTKGKVLSGNDLGNAATVSTSASNNTARVLGTVEPGRPSLPQQNRTASDEIEKWKALLRKKNRLWEKVADSQRKPEAGRSRFLERMRTTFPEDWPCGSPNQTREQLHRLTLQGLDLTQCYRTKEILDRQPSEVTEDLCKGLDKGETLETLQMTAVELQKFASQVKQEWKAWDRWRPDKGCLCPAEANGSWGEGTAAPLPTTVTYRTEAELRELEKLRSEVALLQQERCLEQALSDLLTPQLSSIISGRPSSSVLRDVYSLLGEGSLRFPAIVVDTDPDC